MQDSAEAKELAHKRFFPQQFDGAKASVDAKGHPWLTMEIDGCDPAGGYQQQEFAGC